MSPGPNKVEHFECWTWGLGEARVGRTSNGLNKGSPNHGSPKSKCERDQIAILSVTGGLTECHFPPAVG